MQEVFPFLELNEQRLPSFDDKDSEQIDSGPESSQTEVAYTSIAKRIM